MSAVATSRPVTPYDVVWTRGPVRLLRFRAPVARRRKRDRLKAALLGRRQPEQPQQEPVAKLPVPVLLVPSIINRPAVLDLREGQSLTQHLLSQGLDVFLLDWGEPTHADAHLDLEAYTTRILPRAVRAACNAAGSAQCHLFGYCLGGTFALIAAAANPPILRDKVASIVALTTPVDLRDPGAMGLLTDQRLVDLEKASAWPIVPGPILWTAFQALDPTGGSRKARLVHERRKDKEFQARHKAQEAWLNDPIPMTGKVLRDVVGELYRANALATRGLILRGQRVTLAEGEAPVLNLIAERDTIVPRQASERLAELWGGEVVTQTFRAGHIGITVGTKAPQQMWAAASEWLVARQESPS